MDASTVSKRMFSGAVWMVCLKLSVRAIGLVSTVILARLLIPADFGLVALAMSFYAILDVLTTFNFDMALIQNQKATRDDYNAAWTMNLLMTIGIAIILLSSMSYVSDLFNEPRLMYVFPMMAIMSFLEGLTNIGVVDFRKELELRKEFKYEVSKKVLAFIVTVSAAIYFRSYWALLTGMVVGQLGGTTLSYIMHPFRPRLSLKGASALLNFSKWLLMNNVLFFVNTRLMNLIIGSYYPSKVLGHVSVIKDIAEMTTAELVWPIQRALFPGYSKLTNNPTALVNNFLGSLSVISFVGVPLAVMIAFFNEYVVFIILGDQWLEAAWMLRIMCLAGAFNLIGAATASVFFATGRPKIVTMIALFLAVIRLPVFFYFIANKELEAALYTLLVTSALRTCVSLITIGRIHTISLLAMLAPIGRTFLASFITMFAIVSLTQWFPLQQRVLLDLITVIGMGLLCSVVYLSMHYLFWYLLAKPKGAETIILNFVKSKLNH
ncbi:lipopolysaccharide biosynthesis protein [Zooshikella ganghwensis]|uniref:Lipopolysaccharide biosynthesis protein n=1 Tax=Zooshikella ganghwensis TaxID=202772 RepID=A0A4P9VPL9_9GAMM|nr:lipopolysaccharide biosynthesis protein [Zooshikella ganghwensis]RDH44896.1 lipopolysaccharide biosynthesis protein [Zooshikella ganghwensis]